MHASTALRWMLCVLLLVGVFPATSADTVTVTAAWANVRTGPGTTHPVVSTTRRGAHYSLLSTRQGWHHIQLDDSRTGWIAGSIVRVEQEPRGFQPTARPTPTTRRRIALVVAA